MAHALFTQDLLNAANSVAVAVQEMADAPQQIDIVWPIVTPASTPLQRLDLGEPGFPETKDVLGKFEVLSDLTYGAECVGSFFHRKSHNRPQRFLSWRSLILLFSIFDGLKTITFLGSIGTSSPVLGLRPILRPFLRTTKEPNEESFTFSPRARQSVISRNTNSTRAADSVLDRPTF
jgi:hypothetical protein